MKLLDVLGVLGIGIGVILLMFGNEYGLIGLILGLVYQEKDVILGYMRG